MSNKERVLDEQEVDILVKVVMSGKAVLCDATISVACTMSRDGLIEVVQEGFWYSAVIKETQ